MPRDDSGRTPLARGGVVRRPVASTDPTTSRPALVGQSASAASLQSLPPRCPTFGSGRSSVVGVVEGALLQSTPLFQ